MSYDLTAFELADMLRLGGEMRRLARAQHTLEMAARDVVRHLYESFRNARTGVRQCALVRFYKTHPLGKLPPELQQFARAVTRPVARDSPAETRCLTLVATAGEHPSWNDRRQSRDHQAIPLVSAEIIERAPMIAQLIRAFGLDVASVIAPDTSLVEKAGATYDIFHIENALGSPFIPAQRDFVMPYRIRSVVGFGGSLSRGEMFAVILFANVDITPAHARRFRNIALDLKSEIFRIPENMVFA